MHEKLIHRYCRAVGSYLPCSPRQKREILLGLRQRLEDHCAEHPVLNLAVGLKDSWGKKSA